MTDTPLHIALLGAGQLGSAFALALRAADPSLVLTAYDPDATQAETLRARGGATHVAASLAEAVTHADIVVFAAPVRSFRAMAEAIAPALPAGAIVTDLGSVKCSMEPVAHLLPTARIVPAHPIAGSEKSGAASAREDLFREKLVILTPTESTDPAALEAVEMLWHLTGAHVLQMPIATHDAIYAYMSHLPHAVAFCTAAFFDRMGVEVPADDALTQQFLRIAHSSPRMWTDIFLENREALLPALATYRALLAHMAQELERNAPSSSQPADVTELSRTHLPRLLASALIATLSVYEQETGLELRPFGGAGIRDVVAPAAIDPEDAMAHISTIARAMGACVSAILPEFAKLEAFIGAEEEPLLFGYLTAASGVGGCCGG